MRFEIIFNYHDINGCVKIIEHNKSTNKSLWDYEYNIKDYDNKLYRVMDDINTCCPELIFKEFSILTEYFRQFCQFSVCKNFKKVFDIPQRICYCLLNKGD